ncbi:MAG: RNA polymerase sigma factor [Terriglobales bacterium]
MPASSAALQAAENAAARPELADEALLLRRARGGDADAWAAIYALYQGPIFRFCRHALGHTEDAEDAAAEVLFKARMALDRFDLARPFSPWLYRVAANHCMDMLRRRGRQALSDGDIEAMPLPQPGSDQLEQLIARQSGEQVRAGLAMLPERARMILLLRYYGELSYDEIAATMRVPRPYVGVLLLRARQALRESLSGNGREGPPGGQS